MTSVASSTSQKALDAPERWHQCSLAEVCQRATQQIRPSDADGLPYVGLEHLDTGVPELGRFGDATEVRSAKTRFCSGDVLYGKLRPYLDKAVIAPFDGICSTDILVLRPSGSELNSHYLSLLLHTKSFVRHAVRTTSGVHHPRTSWHAIRQFESLLPPPSEQAAIAEALAIAQQARVACGRVMAAARQLKASLLRHLLTYGPVSVEEAETVELQETEIGGIPDRWSIGKIGDFATIVQYGLSIRGKRLGPHPILRMNNLQDGRVLIHGVQGGVQYVTLDTSMLRKFRLDPGDLLFNRTNSYELVGKTAIFESGLDHVFASYLVRVRLDGKRLDPRFANYYLNMSSTQARLKGLATRAVSQSNINATKLKSFEIPVPPLDEQREIADRLDQVDAKLAAEESHLTALDALFRSLLEELMSGSVRLPEFSAAT